ncbi:alternative NAD(P)H dehydrogenase 1 [Hibiscus syriacus]|uniref:Alternative NAD(P)H dehydrogenase 1 n=1 Tax=Hibiscus syriacus TaxID=106335 RepID=A0A6A3AX73_HIBSY|nr:alternative NAD(P)H dehydrogenase 1 [Hibiscus syriacus]
MSLSKELYPSEDDLLYEEELLRNPFSLKLWWRALVTMHKMPRIWIMYLLTLTEQKLISKARRTFDTELCALPVTQHDRIWEPYLVFVSQRGIPIETSLRVYRRYLKYDPSHIEDFIEFLVNSSLWQEAAERLASVLNDDQFYSIKRKTKHRLWLELCDLLTTHATEVSGLNVDAIIRGGIRKFTDEVGRLWTSLADYYIRRNLFEKARDIFEEGMTTVVTVRDFSVIFDAYSQFEESMVALKMENMELSDEEEEDVEEDEEDTRLDIALCKSKSKFEKKIFKGFWLHDDKDVDLRLARVKLFEGNPTKQILTYTEAVRTIDTMKAVGNPHTLWVAFAKLYETYKDLANVRVIFDKVVQVNYKTVDHLASVWAEWAEMELRHKNFKGALELMRRATAEPSVEVKRRVAADGNEPVQMKLHKSLRMWTFYENKYFEDAFKVYERGVKIFKYPHVKDIWVTYLSKFVKRYEKSKLERARELFEHAVETCIHASLQCIHAPALVHRCTMQCIHALKHRMQLVHRCILLCIDASCCASMHEGCNG